MPEATGLDRLSIPENGGSQMKDQEILAEIETLRAQLKQFEQNRLQQRPSTSKPNTVANLSAQITAEKSSRESAEDWLSSLDDLDTTQILQRIKDVTGNWFTDINDDLKDVSPATLLLILGLGVLVGRLTS
ncbi:MAG: hypothetical protein P8J79_06190 [Halioglobus sp.]|nr:hypothetical protein [Halioglobus sp.]